MDEPADVQIVMVTVDPNHDTTEITQQWDTCISHEITTGFLSNPYLNPKSNPYLARETVTAVRDLKALSGNQTS